MHLSLFITFPPNILVCQPNIFDKSTPVILLVIEDQSFDHHFVLSDMEHWRDVLPRIFYNRCANAIGLRLLLTVACLLVNNLNHAYYSTPDADCIFPYRLFI